MSNRIRPAFALTEKGIVLVSFEKSSRVVYASVYYNKYLKREKKITVQEISAARNL